MKRRSTPKLKRDIDEKGPTPPSPQRHLKLERPVTKTASHDQLHQDQHLQIKKWYYTQKLVFYGKFLMKQIWNMSSTWLFVIQENLCHVNHLFLFQYRLGVGLKLHGDTRVIIPSLTKLCDFLKILRDNKHNRANLAREYSPICSVLVHYLFLEAHSFPSSFRLRKTVRF